MQITKHGRKRFKNRAGKNKLKTQMAIFRKVLKNGITHAEANMYNQELSKYFSKIYLLHRNANNVRIYGDYVYIINRTKLITMYETPKNLKPIVHNIMRIKKENRNSIKCKKKEDET